MPLKMIIYTYKFNWDMWHDIHKLILADSTKLQNRCHCKGFTDILCVLDQICQASEGSAANGDSEDIQPLIHCLSNLGRWLLETSARLESLWKKIKACNTTADCHRIRNSDPVRSTLQDLNTCLSVLAFLSQRKLGQSLDSFDTNGTCFHNTSR